MATRDESLDRQEALEAAEAAHLAARTTPPDHATMDQSTARRDQPTVRLPPRPTSRAGTPARRRAPLPVAATVAALVAAMVSFLPVAVVVTLLVLAEVGPAGMATVRVAAADRLRSFVASVVSPDETRTFAEHGLPESVDRLESPGGVEAAWWYFASGHVVRFRDGGRGAGCGVAGRERHTEEGRVVPEGPEQDAVVVTSVSRQVVEQRGRFGAVLPEPLLLFGRRRSAPERELADFSEPLARPGAGYREAQHAKCAVGGRPWREDVLPGDVIRRARGQHGHVVATGGQVTGDRAAMRLGAPGESRPEAVHDTRQAHHRRTLASRATAP